MKIVSKFRIKSGKHVDEHGKKYKKGDVIETHHSLDTLFDNKFERLPDDSVVPRKKKLKITKADAKAGVPQDDEGTKADDRGEDVTDQFKGFEEYTEEFAVFRRGPWYHIYEKAEKSPIHEKGLKKDDVEKFFNTYLEE